MEKATLKQHDVVQLSPEAGNPMFAGCMMVVTEPKPWGAQGFVQALGENGKPGGQAYYRATWDEMEPVGRAAWIMARHGVEDNPQVPE
jgi:hypothetical protein